MVLDAARAAHIPGVGAFGSGFLSDPTEAGQLEVLPVSSISIDIDRCRAFLGHV